ncbi:hypothetical protein NLG97_g3491 [Lecanicillium saksenae]|uniref:Uncharacterized protein n=1 Tax=Lecanicillium saksenae TaxID=468837 RepID=A0ACC1QXY0_9HYPO|nr:hypothetical protein NLG97_g3491 [Lecanicillium saksenae]
MADFAPIDGRKPTCEACERRKQVCGGYRRGEFVFLNEGWRAPGVASNRTTTATKSKTAKSSATSSTNYEGEPTGFEQLVVLPRAASFSKIHISAFLTSFGSRPSQKLGSLGYLFRQYLPSASLSQYSPQQVAFNSTTPVILTVDALACCHFGMANVDTALIQRGCEVYGMALKSMSRMLAGMNFADVNFQSISEADWGHIAFFCLVMTFWEMKMSPVARSWGGHVRCLAAAIAQRGNSHAYSESNFRLLASSRVLLTLQTLSTRDTDIWQQCSPIRSAWTDEVESALCEAHTDPFNTTDYELYHSVDSLMAEVGRITSIMAQFEQLLNSDCSTDSLFYRLAPLYNSATRILSDNEARLARWKPPKICEVPLPSWPYRDQSPDPISSKFWARMNEADLRPCFETVFTFRTMLDYQSVALYWTIIMLLRLLLADMLKLMAQFDDNTIASNAQQQAEEHRIRLMKYALNVLQTICYATDTESRAVGPFVFVTAFQLATAALEHEHRALQRDAVGDVGGMERCDKLKALALEYLEWSTKNKIPVKIDLEMFKRWSTICINRQGGTQALLVASKATSHEDIAI